MSRARYEAMRDALLTVLLEEAPGLTAPVKSSWCCIEARTVRPARIGADIAASVFPKAD